MGGCDTIHVGYMEVGRSEEELKTVSAIRVVVEKFI